MVILLVVNYMDWCLKVIVTFLPFLKQTQFGHDALFFLCKATFKYFFHIFVREIGL